MRKIDVIVVGSGISGLLTSALLSKKGYQVLLLSRDGGTTNHLPESWIYQPPTSFSLLNIEEKILSALKLDSKCIFASSDHACSVELSLTRESKTIQRGDFVTVDRNVFDQVLLQAALKEGVHFLPFHNVKNCKIFNDKVVLFTDCKGKEVEFVAPYIIDGAGKSELLINQLQLPITEKKLDSRVAYFSHFETSSELDFPMKIFQIESGYAFCIPLSSKRLSIGCVIAEGTKWSQEPPEAAFRLAIASSSYLSGLVNEMKQVLPIIPAKNIQKICTKPKGDRFTLVGDACAFLDPFFCPGIDFALYSAEKAVEYFGSENVLYEEAIKEWLSAHEKAPFKQMEATAWNPIIRLLADPHLPWAALLMVSQSFSNLFNQKHSFQQGVAFAREAYEVEIN